MSRKSSGESAYSSAAGMNMNQQQIAFDVQYVGHSALPKNGTGNGPLQIALLEIYSRFNTPKGIKKFPRVSLLLTKDGLKVNKNDGSLFYSLSNISECRAVTFVGSKTKMNGKKTYGYTFEQVRQQHQPSQQFQNWILSKEQKYLLKTKHSPILACVLRSELGIKTLDVHAFVCQNKDQALSISLSIEMALRTLADKIQQESQLFNYDPYSSSKNDVGNSVAGRYCGVGGNFKNNGGNVGNGSGIGCEKRNEYKQLRSRNAPERQTFSPSTTKDAELPEVIEILGALGAGKGSVVNPVIRTTNVNLINSNFFETPQYQNTPNNENRVFQLNQNDMSRPQQQQQQQQQQQYQQAMQRKHPQQKPSRSASMHFLNDTSLFTEHLTFDDLYHDQKNKASYSFEKNKVEESRKPQVKPVQLSRSRSFKNETNVEEIGLPRKAVTPDDGWKVTNFSNVNDTNFSANSCVNLNPMGDKPAKPIAMVQPRKIQGIKVFPAGNDRTLLIPEKTKFLKKTKNTSQPEQLAASQLKESKLTKRDSMALYATVSKVNRQNDIKNSNVNNIYMNCSKTDLSQNFNVLSNSSNNLNKLTPIMNKSDKKEAKDQFVMKTSSEYQIKKQVVNGSAEKEGRNERMMIWAEESNQDITWN
ncbi:hypothetical protein HELRODRAFT_160204 [Helobdella robusta]|uniref:PID domain-containing protein n=1 Tax=Helobdella robusta TaxID=6412 RepID=T1EPY9_HELRO|nr:hypothetical protein HELRODRAFT_160204 [Helobdella robusta]ESO06073.1 hypothetical protein HELRODRAFT_160204 [Helobdella robusta]